MRKAGEAEKFGALSEFLAMVLSCTKSFGTCGCTSIRQFQYGIECTSIRQCQNEIDVGDYCKGVKDSGVRLEG